MAPVPVTEVYRDAHTRRVIGLMCPSCGAELAIARYVRTARVRRTKPIPGQLSLPMPDGGGLLARVEHQLRHDTTP